MTLLPRFSLRSLILFVALATSGYGLYYNRAPWRPVRLLEGHSDYVLSAAFSPGGKRIVTASYDKTARVWRRHRPEQWWGVAWMPEFWVTVGLGLGLPYSLWRDQGALRRGSVT